jgi:ribokinase/sulfofructose kinase
VDTARVISVPGVHTDFCLVWVPPDGERMLACHNPSLRNMRLEKADRRYVGQARVLFLSGFVPPDLIEDAIHVARAAGLIVTFDLPDTFQDLAGRGLGRARFKQWLPQIDLLMTNHTGLTSLMALDDPEQALEAFQNLAPDMSLAMTMGAKGAWLCHGGQRIYVEAFPVQVLDTTGAGDAFHAGLIYGLLLKEWTLRRAGLFASALAALNCTGLGARGGLVDRETVERFLLARDAPGR